MFQSTFWDIKILTNNECFLLKIIEIISNLAISGRISSVERRGCALIRTCALFGANTEYEPGFLQVGTRFDPKEEIFRNYAGLFGPYSEVELLHSWGAQGSQFTFTAVFVDPSNNVAGSCLTPFSHKLGLRFYLASFSCLSRILRLFPIF